MHNNYLLYLSNVSLIKLDILKLNILCKHIFYSYQLVGCKVDTTLYLKKKIGSVRAIVRTIFRRICVFNFFILSYSVDATAYTDPESFKRCSQEQHL